MKRPTWMALLTLAMLVFGGHLLLNGLSILRGARAAAGARSVPATPEAGAPASPEALFGNLQATTRSLSKEHPWAVRVNAASKVALGALLLFAVAAVYSSDPRGRRATLVAAWAGIAYHIGDAVFLFLVVRKVIVAAAPALAASQSRSPGGGAFTTATAMVTLADILIVVTGVAGIGFSVVLLRFFGGRRGRAFYGLEQQPSHGG
jgi:hypothetical protein